MQYLDLIKEVLATTMQYLDLIKEVLATTMQYLDLIKEVLASGITEGRSILVSPHVKLPTLPLVWIFLW